MIKTAPHAFKKYQSSARKGSLRKVIVAKIKLLQILSFIFKFLIVIVNLFVLFISCRGSFCFDSCSSTSYPNHLDAFQIEFRCYKPQKCSKNCHQKFYKYELIYPGCHQNPFKIYLFAKTQVHKFLETLQTSHL